MKPETQNWIALAQVDYDDSLYLFKAARHPNAVYHMCQAVEKILKAAIIELANEHPPKSHNLVNLALQSGLDFTEAHLVQLKRLRRDYDRVRYRDIAQASYNTKAKVTVIMGNGQTLYVWISKQLPLH